MGRVPGFKENLFPDKALPIFNVVANLGLIFFMNLIGLEMDFELMVTEWKRTVIISVATMAVPFFVSIGSSYAVWESIDGHSAGNNKSFPTYFLFMYVSWSHERARRGVFQLPCVPFLSLVAPSFSL